MNNRLYIIEARAIDAIDRGLMTIYARLSEQARRLMRLTLAVLPLVVILVGSCKTSELPGVQAGRSADEQLRVALLPAYGGQDYVERARDYVESVPETMNHLTQREVTALYGAPAMTRKDADAQVWQYRSDECVMDVYFYGSGDGRPVTYVDYRGKASVSAPASCLNTIAPG
jgi:hypothetical protein